MSYADWPVDQGSLAMALIQRLVIVMIETGKLSEAEATIAVQNVINSGETPLHQHSIYAALAPGFLSLQLTDPTASVV